MAIASIRVNLRARMYHFDQIAILRDGSAQAAKYNSKVKPAIIPSHKDPEFVECLSGDEEKEVVIGQDVSMIKVYSSIFLLRDWMLEDEERLNKFLLCELKVFRISDPEKSNYLLRWPIQGGKYNQSQYSSRNEVLGDIEAIWRYALKDEMGLEMKNLKVCG